MANQEIPRVFVSYAHDSIEHKNNVQQLSDVLIGEYGIDVIADCYEEDNPTGGLLTDFMQIIRQTDRVPGSGLAFCLESVNFSRVKLNLNNY